MPTYYWPPDPAGVNFAFESPETAYWPPAPNQVDFPFFTPGEGGGEVIPFPPPPDILVSVGCRYRSPATRPDRATGSAWAKRNPHKIAAAARWGDAPVLDRATAGGWNEAPHRDRVDGLAWGTGTPQATATTMSATNAPDKDAQRSAAWGTGTPTDDRSRYPFEQATPTDQHVAEQFFTTTTRPRNPWERVLFLHWLHGSLPDTDMDLATPNGPWLHQEQRTALEILLGQPISIDLAFEPTYTGTPNYNPRPADTLVDLPAGIATPTDNLEGLPWGRGEGFRRDPYIGIKYPTYNGPLKDPPTPPTIRLSYLIMNLVNVSTYPAGNPIEMVDIRISYDIDAWAWTFSGTVIGASRMAAIAPDGSGPKDIEIEINGHSWVFMVEQYSQSKRLGDDRYQVQGVSRTQYLAAPYAPLRATRNAIGLSAKQAVEEELFGTGFTLVWNHLQPFNTPDWIFPEDSYSFQGLTPMQVIKRITSAAGAVVLAAPGADQITIQPRHPISPWALAGETMDKIIHYSLVTSLGYQFIPAQLYNAAYVSGTTHGKGVMVTRSGTGGDAPAPDTFEDWLVATEVNRERGREIIAASGNHAIVTIDLPIPENSMAPGIVLPGTMVEFQDAAASWRGYTLGIDIMAPGYGPTNVKQTAKVIRYHEHG